MVFPQRFCGQEELRLESEAPPCPVKGTSGLSRYAQALLRSPSSVALDGGMINMPFRHETKSLAGLVQLLAANLLPHGYYFYVTGRVPEGKCPETLDAKLVAKYNCDLSRSERSRRKQVGQASLHYLRHETFWILLATHGQHRFFAEEGERVRDIRKVPLQFGGYSLTVRRGDYLRKLAGESKAPVDGRWRSRVQISREQYQTMRAHFLALATHRSAETLAREFFHVPFEPYAPIRKQLLNLLRLVNESRQRAGYAKLTPECIRYRRRIVRPFDDEFGPSRDDLGSNATGEPAPLIESKTQQIPCPNRSFAEIDRR